MPYRTDVQPWSLTVRCRFVAKRFFGNDDFSFTSCREYGCMPEQSSRSQQRTQQGEQGIVPPDRTNAAPAVASLQSPSHHATQGMDDVVDQRLAKWRRHFKRALVPVQHHLPSPLQPTHAAPAPGARGPCALRLATWHALLPAPAARVSQSRCFSDEGFSRFVLDLLRFVLHRDPRLCRRQCRRDPRP